MKTRTKKVLGFGTVVLMVSLMLVPISAIAYGQRPIYIVDKEIEFRGNYKYVFTYYSNNSIFVQEYLNIQGRIHGGRAYGYEYKLISSGWMYNYKYPFNPVTKFLGVPPHTVAPLE